MTRRSFSPLGAVAAALFILGLIAPPTADAAAVPATASPKPTAAARDTSITLTGQPAWSTLGDDVTFRLNVRTGSTPALEVHAFVYSAVLSRIAFERTLTGDLHGSPVASRSAAIDAMPVIGNDRLLTIGLQDPASSFDATRIRLSLPGSGTAGVFPVQIELREPNSGQVLDSFVTDIVATRRRTADEAPGEPLQVGWLWNIAAPPSVPGSLPTSSPSALTAAVAPRGRLGRLATALGQIGDVPVTLVPDPETIDALRLATPAEPRAATVLGAIRTASRSALVLAGPYSTVDGPSLLHAGLGPAFDGATTAGRTALEAGLDTAVDHTIAANQPLDTPTLTELRAQGGTTRVVLEPDALTGAPDPDQFTVARPFRLDTTAAVGSFDALEVNPIASDLLIRPGPDALRAQQLLASLSVIALEQPNRARGVVINTPLLWNVSPNRVGTILAGLRDHPLLRGATVGDLFDSVQAATVNRKPYSRTLAPVALPQAPISLRDYNAASESVDALGSMIGTSQPVVARLRRELLLSLGSRIPGTGPSVSAARVTVIDNEVAAVTSKISAPASRTVTLTSRRASVPLSIVNSSDRIVKVRVTLASQKLDFPKGSKQILDLPPGRNKTVKFDVEARASGTFPVLVTVSSPDGKLDLQRARYTVRSSAVSGVGLVLTISTVLFLAAWWLTHWRRSRRVSTPAVAS